MNNLFIELRNLLPQPPLLVATVLAVHTSDSTVQFPGGGIQRVRGTGVAADLQVFVRNGVIEGEAPELPYVEIDV